MDRLHVNRDKDAFRSKQPDVYQVKWQSRYQGEAEYQYLSEEA